MLPCQMPRVKISTPRSLRAAATGRGSPPLEYPSVIRKMALVALARD